MRPDIDELRRFYDTRQGQLARRLINAQIRRLWPGVRDHTVLGLGYATPFLPVLTEARRAIALMPAAQGVERWPEEAPNLTALARDDDLPLADQSVDRILLVHAIEGTTHVNRLMRELWRVLADGGRLLAVVPNRTGLWGWSERTPFGHGQCYSLSQLGRLLTRQLFAPTSESGALYLPPSRSSFVMRLAVPTERLGRRLVPNIAGVVMVEAEKRLYLGRSSLAKARVPQRGYAPVPQGLVAARDGAETTDRIQGHSSR